MEKRVDIPLKEALISADQLKSKKQVTEAVTHMSNSIDLNQPNLTVNIKAQIEEGRD